MGIATLFVVGLFANLDTYTATKSWTVWAAVTVAQAVAGLAALRVPIARRYAASWSLAVMCGSLLALTSVLISRR